jgi:hypothetical protein
MAREDREVRKELSGPEAAPYMGQARVLLGNMKNIMRLGGLSQLRWVKDLADGVRVTVSSVFGQDKVTISTSVKAVKHGEPGMRSIQSRGEAIFCAGNIFLYEWSRNNGLVQLSGSANKTITAVSMDGTTLVGYDTPTGGSYKWTKSLGFEVIADFLAEAVSGDGSILVGSSGGNSALWTSAGGVEVIGSGSALGISEDGTVVAGYTTAGNSYRWTRATGVVEIGSFLATGISPDGSTIFGDDTVNPVLWRASTGEVTIPLPAGVDVALPKAISGDGSVLVGTAFFSDGLGYPHEHVFKYTAVAGIEVLGAIYTDPALHDSNTMVASGISYDGGIIVGQGVGMRTSSAGTSFQSFRWTQANGFESLGELSGASEGLTVIASPLTVITIPE